MLIDDLNAIDRDLIDTVAKLTEQIEGHTRRDTKAVERFTSQTEYGVLRAALEVVSASLRTTQAAVALAARYVPPQQPLMGRRPG